jgi:hypothetical protein
VSEVLHILNGRSTEDTLRQSAVPGKFFSFRDVLIDGPAPATTTAEQWRQVRARHLAAAYGVDLEACEGDLLDQEAVLASHIQHEEVVLWFEHDLFCQLNLLYLLDWFARASVAPNRLSLINIGEFPGHKNFRGLGELSVKELSSLFPQRSSITADQLQLANQAWSAHCSSDPSKIESLMRADTSALPFLQTAFAAHLRRFPATKNGLGQIENTALRLIDEGCETFADVFPRFATSEPVYGLGDAQLWLGLSALSNAPTPLLTIEDSEKSSAPMPGELSPSARFKLTAEGRAVVRQQADFIELNGIDSWLGGAHLHAPDVIWCWNEETGKLHAR